MKKRKRKWTRRVPVVDMVNHPPHYTKGQFETIDVIEDVCQFYPAKQAYAMGNVFRYISRACHKGDKLEDLKKAQFYMNRLVDMNA